MTAHQDPPIYADLLDCRSANVVPSVVNPVNCTVPVKRKGIGDINFAVVWIRGVDHLQFVKQPAIGIHQKGPISAKGISRLVGVHFIIDRDSDQFAIIDAHLQLQVSDVVRQLATVFRSIITPIKNENTREAV